MTRLKEYGYLNDQPLPRPMRGCARRTKSWAQRRVRQDLQQKGVGAELIDEPWTRATAQTNEEALAREHLERKRISKAGEREGDGAGDAAAGDGGVLNRHDLQNSAPVGCAGRSAGRAGNLDEEPHEE